MPPPPDAAAEDDRGPSRAQRALVLGALGALLLGGLVEVEAWPVTAWRLFSEARRDEQSGLVLEAVDGTRAAQVVPLADLPLGYRLASWPLGRLRGEPLAARAALCTALLDEVRSQRPGVEELRVLRTRRRMVRLDGGWRSVEVETDAVVRCAATSAP